MSLSTPARGALPALPGWAVFFFGLSLTTNVVYLFKVGNTAVPIGYVVALPLAAVLLYAGAKGGGWPRRGHRQVGLAVLRPRRHVALREPRPRDRRCDSRGCPLAVLRGLAVLFCGLAVYMVCASPGTDASRPPGGHRSWDRLEWRVFVCGPARIRFRSYFSLYSLFPKSPLPFAPPGRSGGQLSPGSGRLTTFRPQGLFLETSHLMVFLVCFAPLAFLALRGTLVRCAVAAASLYCAVSSLSPNALFLLAEVAILFAANGGGGSRAGVRSACAMPRFWFRHRSRSASFLYSR